MAACRTSVIAERGDRVPMLPGSCLRERSRIMLIWQAHQGKIESVAISPDGRYLATATEAPGSLYSGFEYWEVGTQTNGELAIQVLAGSDQIARIRKGSRAFLAAGTARSVTVWRATDWELLADLDLPYAYELVFGPGEMPLLAASSCGNIVIWTDAARLIRRFDSTVSRL